MKLLFISDIHGNFPALEAVWKKENDSDFILCAGDLVDCGFYPKEVVDWCREHGVITVSGNHDRGLCQAYDAQKAGIMPQEGSLLEYNLSKLTEEDVDYLKQLKKTEIFRKDNLAVYIKHFYGKEEENRKALLERWIKDEALMAFEEEWPEGVNAQTRIMYTGHSHQSWLYQANEDTFYLNPGSVSYRVNTDSRAKGAFYAVYEDEHLELRHASYEPSVFVPCLESVKLTEEARRSVGFHLVYTLPV